MTITVTNAGGDPNLYVGFSNSPDISLSSVLDYFKNLTSDTKGQAYKLATAGASQSSGSFKYVLLCTKNAPNGGALLFRIADLESKFGSGLDVRVTTHIASDGVLDGDSTLAIGSVVSTPTLYVKLPVFSITANVKITDAADLSRYTNGGMTSAPVYAYGNAGFNLGIVGVNFELRQEAGGWPIWVWFLILAVFILVVIIAIFFGHKAYKKKMNGY